MVKNRLFRGLLLALVLLCLTCLMGETRHAAAEEASEAMLQSPLGESPTVPTLGPSGMQERLNCCEKNLRQKTLSHLRMVSLS